MRRYLVVIGGLLLLVGGLVALKGAQIGKLIGFGKAMEKSGPPPEIVSSSVAEKQAWEGSLSSIGTVASSKGVTLSNDLPGVVSRILFESGATVREGQVLVELDTSVERAQLASAIARRDLATKTIDRTRSLVASGSLSQAQLDNDESLLRTATTDVEGIQAQIARKTVRAPFAGKLGIRQVNLGQYLGPGTPITVLETIDALHVDFTLPQQRLSELKVGMPVRIQLEAEAGAPIQGTIGAIDPAVDATTRTIRLRANVPNATEALRPGMFVRVSVLLPGDESVVAVPATAILHAPYGDSVFVVEDKPAGSPGDATTRDGKTVKSARQQFVRVGLARGDFVSVLDGVKPGQELVIAGGFKLRNGAPIVVDNTKRPAFQLNPHPENR